ncbi:D-isomer specific 2-hydroxyacid dehydrogenase NAD-binding [Penicillium vulpinum]|nr:D-isomer specific 2-hydroxyacid dehydrogenase NAD-binding [Penicillium vulpinum]KAJ5971261.1 D-isomer specific 2-hydroxyacid dehydrogenase NAD-binding [Penicillium vulpinum]
MSGVQSTPNTLTERQFLEREMMNLGDCILRRERLAESLPVNLEEFEELGRHIAEAKVEIAKQIRRVEDPWVSDGLQRFYLVMIGNMPNRDGTMP